MYKDRVSNVRSVFLLPFLKPQAPAFFTSDERISVTYWIGLLGYSRCKKDLICNKL